MVLASPDSILDERIKLIDLPRVDLTAERSTAAKLIVKACEEYGFFNVVNHGIPHDIITKMEEAGFDFFAKPLQEKKEAAFGDYPFGYGSKNIGFNGDKGEVEYLLLKASSATDSVAPLSKNVYNDPSNFRYVHSLVRFFNLSLSITCSFIACVFLLYRSSSFSSCVLVQENALS